MAKLEFIESLHEDKSIKEPSTHIETRVDTCLHVGRTQIPSLSDIFISISEHLTSQNVNIVLGLTGASELELNLFKTLHEKVNLLFGSEGVSASFQILGEVIQYSHLGGRDYEVVLRGSSYKNLSTRIHNLAGISKEFKGSIIKK